MTFVRTVLGDIAPADLGRTDYHEHLLMSSPLLAGDELDDVERSAQETQRLHAAGIDALVELTPIGLGRDPTALAEISQRCGVHVVAATGVHQEAHYASDDPLRRLTTEQLTEVFVAELTEGCAGAPIRAGVVKVGVGYWSISEMERQVLAAAAAAHHRTGAPIVCHLEMGTAAHDVVALLTAAGLPAECLALAHADRNPDAGLHAELTQEGVFLGYDGMARAKYWPDSTLIACLLATAERGRADRLLLGGDVARRSRFRCYGGLPGMEYLPSVFVPRLAREGGEDLVRTLLVDNPASFFAFNSRRRGDGPTGGR